MAAAKKVLGAHVHVTKKDGTVVLITPGQELPGWAEKLVTNPKAFREAEAADEASLDSADGSTVSGYGGQGLDELKDELKRRELPVSGNKPELVARLEEHDKQKAAEAAAAGAGDGGDAGNSGSAGDGSEE